MIICYQIIVAFVIPVSEAISVSGEWGDWGDWTGCSVTCGYGTINRSRNWIYVDGIVTNFTFVSFLQCWTKIPCPSKILIFFKYYL